MIKNGRKVMHAGAPAVARARPEPSAVIWTGLCFLLTAHLALADYVETTDRKIIDGRIATVADDGIRNAATGAHLAWADVRRVVFSRPAVHAAETRLLLRDGSALCGVIRRLTKDRIVFRSVSVGELDLGMDQVAALEFADGAALAAVRNASATNVVALLRSGLVHSGTLVFASANNLLLKTTDGMEKLALENLSGLVVAAIPASGGPGVVLRNGDVFCASPQWSSEGFNTTVGGINVAINFEALAEIRR